jgi:hypothetical protein
MHDDAAPLCRCRFVTAQGCHDARLPHASPHERSGFCVMWWDRTGTPAGIGTVALPRSAVVPLTLASLELGQGLLVDVFPCCLGVHCPGHGRVGWLLGLPAFAAASLVF